MAQIIGLPKLSPTMEEGVLVKWVKGEGDAVEPGDLVAEVETDKANMDFNLEDEGVLLKLLVAEGDTVKLGAPVAILGEEGEDITALVEQAEAMRGGGGEAAPATAEQAAAPSVSALAAAPADETLRPSEPARVPATEPPPVPAAKPGPAPAAKPGPAPAAPAAPGARILASPLAKTLAIELGVDLRTVTGTGPGGRIVERDVRNAETSPPAAPPAPARADDTSLAVVPPATPPAAGDYRDEPLTGMRKTIAARMLEAKRDIPHFYLTRSFDAAPMLQFRARLNQLLGERGKVSVNDLIIKGCALALRRVPACNASFMGTAIRYHRRVHIGVAVATERGLITPVVRDADLKGLGVIAAEVRDLAGRARDRALKMDEIQGSTFTVSNLGMFGVDSFQAIVNPPEGGILAVGATVERAVVVDGEIVIGKRMDVTMSCDHRVIDGALGAQFLAELADLLEKPESLAL